MAVTANDKYLEINGERWVREASIPPRSDGVPPYSGVMLVETVTKYFIGKVEAVFPNEIVLKDACWVADTGRYHKFLAEGGDEKTEFEPCPDGPVIIGRGSIVSAHPWKHGLVRGVK